MATSVESCTYLYKSRWNEDDSTEHMVIIDGRLWRILDHTDVSSTQMTITEDPNYKIINPAKPPSSPTKNIAEKDVTGTNGSLDDSSPPSSISFVNRSLRSSDTSNDPKNSEGKFSKKKCKKLCCRILISLCISFFLSVGIASAFLVKTISLEEDISNNKIEVAHLKSQVIQITNTRCLSSCEEAKDGNYQSCVTCTGFVSCSNHIKHEMTCPNDSSSPGVILKWDDVKKDCLRTSTTCF